MLFPFERLMENRDWQVNITLFLYKRQGVFIRAGAVMRINMVSALHSRFKNK